VEAEDGLSFSGLVLHATVGTGTFGRVRVCELKTAPQGKYPLALKIMKKIEVVRLKQIDHIRNERAIMGSLAHPFIVNLIATFQDPKRICVLLEYVNGGELFSYLRNEGQIADKTAKIYSGEIVLAFAYLHEKMIAYRDLKPENVLIDSAGFMKVTDFGFAKVVEDRTWTLCGTPEYLAPEIIQSKGHNMAVDWWAVGVLIYEMLAGYPPYYDDNPFGIYQMVIEKDPAFPQGTFKGSAKSLIKKLLVKDPTKRLGCMFAGAEDVKEHKWYGEIDWDRLLNRDIEAPYLPKVKSAIDTSQFDKYPESTCESATVPVDQKPFEGF
jgi:serine/threonine protein kinase